MLAVVARCAQKRPVVQATRLLHTRTACLVDERDGSGAGGAAKVIVVPAGPATVVTPNTQPNTHYTSSVHTRPAPVVVAAPATPPPVSPPPPSQPTQQKPVVVAAPPPPSSPSSSYDYSHSHSRPRPSIRSRLTAFLVGVGVATGAGYYRLQSDVWSSARALEGQIAGLKGGGAAGQDTKAGADRMAALEKRVAELEKDKARK